MKNISFDSNTLLFRSIKKSCSFIKKCTHNSLLKLDYLFFETPCSNLTGLIPRQINIRK